MQAETVGIVLSKSGIYEEGLPYAHSARELAKALSEIPEFLRHTEEAYVTAMLVCSEGRGLLVDFYQVWAHPDYLGHAPAILALMGEAVAGLEKIRDEGAVNPEHMSHMDDMIKNTQERIAILEVMAGEGDLVSRKIRAQKLYNAMGDKNRIVELVP